MTLLATKNPVFRNSTALVLTLALSASPSAAVFAQQANTTTVDCVADPTNAACAQVPSVDATPESDPTAEPGADGAVVPEDAPVPEEVVEAAPAEEVREEITADEITSESEAEVETSVEADTEVQIEAEADASVQPVEEVPADEATSAEPASEEMPSAEQAPSEEAASEADAVDETSSEEAPAEEATTEDAPVEQEAAQESPEEAPAAEQQASEDMPTAETDTPEPTASSDAGTDELPTESVEETDAAASASPDTDAPATVVADEITAEQRAQIQADEERRREEARERRDELLGAAAIGAAIGVLIPALGGTVVQDQGDRIIVERDGDYFVRRDENSLLRDGDVEVRVERLGNGHTQETVTRANGVEIITIRDSGGFVLYRSRVMPSGREFVLIDNRDIDDRALIDFDRQLPPLELGIPMDLYIVPARQAGYDTIYQTFTAPPVQQVEQTFTLRQVRESERLRDLMRRVDLDTITFETDQAFVRQSQVPLLKEIARAANTLIDENPSAVLLVEGHTDAVGSDIYNLALSDRRAETVARILVNVYDVPPENLVVQGYGERHLKVRTQAPEERNRRVTIRNITPLLGS